ncbi:MAG: ABC transporter ATP-binding protein [Clostridiales bacterium]|nr:ABC transporter ATP-binding protein [Clostridiales bacterium]
MRTNRNRIRAVWGFAKKYWRLFTLAELCILGTYAVSAALPLNLALLTDRVLMGGEYGLLGPVLGGYAGLFLASTLLNGLYAYVWQSLHNKYIVDVKTALYKKLLFAKGIDLLHMDAGDCMSRIDTDADAFIHAVQKNLFHFCNSLLLCTGILAVTAFLHPLVALGLLAAAGLPILLTRMLGRFTRRYAQRMRDSDGKAAGRIYDILEGVRDVRLLGAEGWARACVRRWADTQIECGNGLRRVDFIADKAVQLLNLAASVGIYALMLWLLLQNGLTIGTCLALLQYIGLLHRKLNWALRLALDWQARKVSIDRVLEVLDMEEERRGGRPVESIRSIRLEGVSFSYTEEQEERTLRQITLDLPAGARVGLVGLSGAGKTTLIGLLAGLYEPSEGRVLVNGQDLSQLDLRDYRDHIGAVQQETALFRDTLRFNLCLGRKTGEEELAAVCRQAGLEEVVRALPQGLDTPLGEDFDLSSGQKQRVMIARALLRRPDLLLFDESTAALDRETERLLQENQVFRQRDCITVVISHRLSTLQDCDRIVFLEAGAVRGMGTHRELWNRDSAYRAMFGEAGKDALSA